MKKLIFDIQISGHHSEYISHLVNYLCLNKSDDDYIFLVHSEFSVKFRDIVDKAKSNTKITWVEITPEEQFEISKSKNIVYLSFITFKLMDAYAKYYEVGHVYLLYFNTFQLPLIFYRTHYAISGVLFLQFYRMTKNTLKGKLKYLRKYYTTKLYAKNKQIKNVFVLNDEKSVHFLNKTFKVNFFKVLADPIPVLLPENGFNIRDKFSIPSNKKIFLHFGSLDARKGTLEILEAFNYIEEKYISEITLLLIGTASSSEFDYKIKTRIKSITNNNINSHIFYKNEFVSNSKMKSYFEQSDFVLIPYKNSEASSGILGHAVAASKPLISSKHGLIGELIKDNNFGVLLDNITPENIAKSIVKGLNTKFNFNNSEFVLNHSADSFVNTIIGSDEDHT